ncbi:hypothetical protein JL193_07140 [Polaribacter batillariae]|uniref:Uncharacterized protein n=1 Tax=Polaribacter batillariae TaxID=2808900 RepID=A0ABX7T180_9FLAO|nr:hypothetical protein [Polaribacter batillariae]QTD39016.1 hypothetical protein JL193_07140 [Polaribacter batillariae]
MPETPQTSEQMQQLTSSQNGTNKVAKLQSQSHFFIQGNNFIQTPEQSFGAISENQFRTTASVSFSEDKEIYALCKGVVFLQPQTGNDTKVNLILKPFKQPINGINIKYIIYRGLNKSDFINTATNPIQIKGKNTPDPSGFITYLWSEFEKFYGVEDGGIAPDFLANFIGFPTSTAELEVQTDSSLIDQYFYKIAEFFENETAEEKPESAYEFPMVERGLHLGNATDQIGIDIILNNGDYTIEETETNKNPFQLNLAYARADFYTLDTSTQPTDFNKKRIKEAATKFLDIAAFYGLQANGAGKLYIDNTTAPLITKETIATRLENFHTKNNFYLYIQSNRQRSYNFYENYIHPENTNALKIGATVSNVQETTFGTLGWPIHVLNNSQDVATENNTITFQLITDNYQDAALFTQIGVINSAHENNFVRNINLLQEPLDDPAVIIDTNYTQPITLITPSIAENTIASFAQIIYEGKEFFVESFVPPPEAGEDPAIPEVHALKDIDDVFGLLNAKGLFTTSNNNQLPTVVSEDLQIINFPNTSNSKDIGTIKHKKIEDRLQTVDESTYINRVTYETLLDKIKISNPVISKKNTINIDAVTGMFHNQQQSENYNPKSPYFFSFVSLNIFKKEIIGLLLKTNANDTPTKIILGLTKNQSLKLENLVKDNTLNNAKIFFKNKNIKEDYYHISESGIKYKQYALNVIGEDADGNLKIYEPNEELLVYTLDGYAYASNEYAKYVPQNYESEYYINLIN